MLSIVDRLALLLEEREEWHHPFLTALGAERVSSHNAATTWSSYEHWKARDGHHFDLRWSDHHNFANNRSGRPITVRMRGAGATKAMALAAGAHPDDVRRFSERELQTQKGTRAFLDLHRQRHSHEDYLVPQLNQQQYSTPKRFRRRLKNRKNIGPRGDMAYGSNRGIASGGIQTHIMPGGSGQR